MGKRLLAGVMAGGRKHAEDPSPARVVTVVAAFVVANGAIFLAARSVADPPHSALGLVVSVGGGILAAVLIGSLGEWFVHRYVMHRRWGPRPLHLAAQHHRRQRLIHRHVGLGQRLAGLDRNPPRLACSSLRPQHHHTVSGVDCA